MEQLKNQQQVFTETDIKRSVLLDRPFYKNILAAKRILTVAYTHWEERRLKTEPTVYFSLILPVSP